MPIKSRVQVGDGNHIKDSRDAHPHRRQASNSTNKASACCHRPAFSQALIAWRSRCYSDMAMDAMTKKNAIGKDYQQEDVPKPSLNDGSFQVKGFVGHLKLEQVLCEMSHQFREQLTFHHSLMSLMFRRVFLTLPCLIVRKCEWIIFP